MAVPRTHIMELRDWSTADAKANYDGASNYEARLHKEGEAVGRAKAAECAAQIVETMPLIGRRQRTANQIRRDCS